MTAPAPLPVGPFALEARIGRGGMGEVWRGVHLAQGVPVAVKVMTGERARDPHYRTFFRNEVQAVAGLDHPGIVMVFDHGEVGPDAESASGGLLPAGSPYLAMELAGHGTLREIRRVGWRRLRAMALALLDALAHAHARGVIHRDLKPSNVLRFGLGDPALELKLADFGLAHTVDRERRTGPDLVSGTPHYMAPEQIRGAWRDYGPWTDLYSLGCVVHELATGQPVFAGRDPIQAQLHEKPRRLASRIAVPGGLESWLLRLLQKDPAQRFQAAADASWALRSLGPAEGEDEADADIEEHRTDPDLAGVASPLDASDLPTSHFINATDSGPKATAAGPADAGQVELGPRRAPPLPRTWERTRWQGGSLRLVGAGLGLYGLRSIPLVGRRAERDALWRTLVEAREGGRARVVLLQGPAGTGKSRLAEWIAERAHEVGGATTLKAVHGPTPGPGDGLPRMMARHFGCVGLSRGEARERVAGLLRAQGIEDEGESSGLAELLALGTLSPSERYALVRNVVARIARERPVVLLLDDVQWAGDALDGVAHALAVQDRDPLPILILMTARDEALAERPVEAAQIEALLARPGALRLDVPPLPPEDRGALVQELLGLAGDLAAQVAERTGGNPLFAVHLIGDWVQRGVLEPAASGFVLKAGERAELPDDLHQVWVARVRQLLAEQPPAALAALEIGAALGRSVDQREWDAACREAGVAGPRELVDALVSGRLARRVDQGWAVVHGMLRESLERMAREEGRWERWNRCCAAMLRSPYEAGLRGTAERLGGHLREAGDREGSIEPLLRGARERRETSDYRLAHALLDERDAALAALPAPVSDPRWGEGWVLRARIFLHLGRLDDVFLWAERAERAAEEHGWTTILSEALRLLGDAARRRGDLAQAAGLYERCIALLDRLDTPHGVAASLWGLGDVARQRAELDRALELFERSRALYETIGDQHGVADHHVGAADVAWQRRDLATAGRLYGEALALFETLGNRYGAARCLNGLGEVARKEGQLSRAESHYRRALAIQEAIGSSEAVFARLNLGLVGLAAGRYDEAQAFLEAGRAELISLGWRGLLACVDVALASCAARAGNWAAWDGHMDRGTAAISDAAMVEPDVAWCAEHAGDLAAAAGETVRAGAAYALALAQWTALGHEDRAAKVRTAMRALGPA